MKKPLCSILTGEKDNTINNPNLNGLHREVGVLNLGFLNQAVVTVRNVHLHCVTGCFRELPNLKVLVGEGLVGLVGHDVVNHPIRAALRSDKLNAVGVSEAGIHRFIPVFRTCELRKVGGKLGWVKVLL